MRTESQEMHKASSPICIPHISDYPIFWVRQCHLGVSAYKILVSCRRIVREWRETRWQKYMYLYCRFITTNIPFPCFCWRKNIILIKFHLPSIPLAVQFIIALLLFCKETKLLAGDDINHWGGGGCARKSILQHYPLANGKSYIPSHTSTWEKVLTIFWQLTHRII